jgi:multisubunit Na+/H+ antiporter MnhB subunit
VILIGIACLVIFLLLDVAWAAWGAFGVLLVVGLGLLLFAWLYDRRHAREY